MVQQGIFVHDWIYFFKGRVYQLSWIHCCNHVTCCYLTYMRFEWEKLFSSQIINCHTTPAIPRVHVEITIHLKIQHFRFGLLNITKYNNKKSSDLSSSTFILFQTPRQQITRLLRLLDLFTTSFNEKVVVAETGVIKCYKFYHFAIRRGLKLLQ